MSSIESSNQSLNNILEKIGVRSPEDAPNKRKNSLGQEDFLKLNYPPLFQDRMN